MWRVTWDSLGTYCVSRFHTAVEAIEHARALEGHGRKPVIEAQGQRYAVDELARVMGVARRRMGW